MFQCVNQMKVLIQTNMEEGKELPILKMFFFFSYIYFAECSLMLSCQRISRFLFLKKGHIRLNDPCGRQCILPFHVSFFLRYSRRKIKHLDAQREIKFCALIQICSCEIKRYFSGDIWKSVKHEKVKTKNKTYFSYRRHQKKKRILFRMNKSQIKRDKS